jgi:hypothetical protein
LAEPAHRRTHALASDRLLELEANARFAARR